MAGTPNTPGSGFPVLPPGLNLTPKPAKTQGFYVFIACAAGIILSNTRAAPFAFGILGIALIYQLNNLIAGT